MPPAVHVGHTARRSCHASSARNGRRSSLRRSISSRVRVPMALVLASLVLAPMAPAVAADDGLQVTTPYPAVAVAPGSK